MAGHSGDSTPSVWTVAAVLALLALTVLAALRATHDQALWERATLVAAWTTILVVSLILRGRRVERAPGPDEALRTAASVAEPPAEDVHEPEAFRELFRFAQDVHTSVQGDRLRILIAQRLPDLVGLRQVWVVAQFGERRHVITPLDPKGESTLRMLSGGARDWATFPMMVEGEVVGVLGVGMPSERFSQR
jgi:hypothetical protein